MVCQNSGRVSLLLFLTPQLTLFIKTIINIISHKLLTNCFYGFIINLKSKGRNINMEEKTKNELLKMVDIARESVKNNMDVTLETYAEVFSKLDTMTYLIMSK